MKSGLLLTAATAAALLIVGNAARAAWDFTNIADAIPEATAAEAYVINNHGHVMGSFQPSGFATHGFRASGGRSTVDVPAIAATTAAGANNSGQISGYSGDGSGGFHGFTQTGASPMPFGEPGAVLGSRVAAGMSAAEIVVGSYFDMSGAEHAFTKSGAILTSLEATGQGSARNNRTPGIHTADTIVGAFVSGDVERGFADSAGTNTHAEDPLGVNGMWANGTDTGGDVVAYHIDGGNVPRGFVDPGGVLYTANDPDAATGGALIEGVNNALMVVGYYVDPSGLFAGLSAEVPEPGTFALFGLSATGMAAFRRRRVRVAA